MHVDVHVNGHEPVNVDVYVNVNVNERVDCLNAQARRWTHPRQRAGKHIDFHWHR